MTENTANSLSKPARPGNEFRRKLNLVKYSVTGTQLENMENVPLLQMIYKKMLVVRNTPLKVQENCPFLRSAVRNTKSHTQNLRCFS